MIIYERCLREEIPPAVHGERIVMAFPRPFTFSAKCLIRSRTPEWLTIRDLFSIGYKSGQSPIKLISGTPILSVTSFIRNVSNCTHLASFRFCICSQLLTWQLSAEISGQFNCFKEAPNIRPVTVFGNRTYFQKLFERIIHGIDWSLELDLMATVTVNELRNFIFPSGLQQYHSFHTFIGLTNTFKITLFLFNDTRWHSTPLNIRMQYHSLIWITKYHAIEPATKCRSRYVPVRKAWIFKSKCFAAAVKTIPKVKRSEQLAWFNQKPELAYTSTRQLAEQLNHPTLNLLFYNNLQRRPPQPIPANNPKIDCDCMIP